MPQQSPVKRNEKKKEEREMGLIINLLHTNGGGNRERDRGSVARKQKNKVLHSFLPPFITPKPLVTSYFMLRNKVLMADGLHERES